MRVPEVLGIQVHFGNPKAFGNLEGNHLTRDVDVGGWRQGLAATKAGTGRPRQHAAFLSL